MNQLEEYLKYIHAFSRLEAQITNLVSARYSTLKHLAQISTEVGQLKKFEFEAPRIMLALREQAIRIVKLLCRFSQWRNPDYISFHLQSEDGGADPLDVELPTDLREDAQANSLSNSFFFFESKVGQGNVLDFIRSGRAPFHSAPTAGREKLHFKEVKTHIMKRMSLFFADDKILFLPKDQAQIEHDLKLLDNSKENYKTQEIGIFYKIIDQLKLSSPEEE
jgi:hypothetical protein